MKKRILPILIAILIAAFTLTLLSLTVWADTITEIKTVTDLKAMSSSGKYKLSNDLVLTEAVTISSFSGSLDGNGKTISGIAAPLFGTLSGEVSDLTLKGAITQASTGAVGALANKANAALTVQNVTVDVTLKASSAKNAAGFIGEVAASSKTAVRFANCTNKGDISAKANVAGFVGSVTNSATAYSTVSFSYCINEGAISMTATDANIGAGGFVGFGGRYSDIVAEYVSNRGNISTKGGDNGAGGILGGGTWASGDAQTFTARYASNYGNVTIPSGRGRAGGICGRMNRNGSSYLIEYCYNVGTITAADDSAAGIFSYSNASAAFTVRYCYNAGSLKNASRIFPIAGHGATSSVTSADNYYYGSNTNHAQENVSCAKASSQDQLNRLLTGLENSPYFVDPDQNNGFAILVWECDHEGKVKNNCLGSQCSACGTLLEAIEGGKHSFGDWIVDREASETVDGEKHRTCSSCKEVETAIIKVTVAVTPTDGVYLIKSAGELLWLFHEIEKGGIPASAAIRLTKDIDTEGALTTVNTVFTGSLDGNGKTLSGLCETLFHDFRGTVKDLTIRGDLDYSSATHSFDIARKASSFARNTEGASFSGLVSYVNVTTSRNDLNAGGIVGYAKGGTTFTDCAYYGTYTANWAGDNAGVGGIVGWTNAGSSGVTLIRCAFGGTIILKGGAANKNGAVGGIVGNASNDRVSITDCVSNGTITSTAKTGTDFVGGILGINNGGALVLSGCASRSELTAVTNAGGILGGAGVNTTIAFAAHYGKVTAKTAGAIVGTAQSATVTVSDSADFSKSALKLSGTTATLKNSFTADQVTDLQKDFSFDGVSYKRYNVGVCERESGKLVPTLSTTAPFTAYLSLKDEGKTHAIRFVFLTHRGLSSESVTVSIVFKDKSGNTVKSKIGTLSTENSDYTLYSAVKAAGELYFAKSNQALFGCVITDIPNGAFQSVEVTVEDTASGTVYLAPVTLDLASLQFTPENMPDFSSLGTISATYNAGPGLMSDKTGVTNEDNLMKVISNTTAKKLSEYTKVLEAKGYIEVSKNTLDGDVYYTYEKFGKLFYLYHNEKLGETRIIVDNASDKLSEIEVNYTPKSGDTTEFYQYSLNYDLANKAGYDPVVYTEATSQNCGMLYVIKLADNSVIVIDGGGDKQSTVKSRAGFLKFLRSITNTPDTEKVRIASWFFSHAHGDHVRFAADFINQHYAGIDLVSVTHNFPSYQVVGGGYDDNTFTMKANVNRRFPNTLYHKLHTGEVLNMAGVTIEVVFTHEDATTSSGASEIGDFNSTSTVLKITIDGMSIMLLGDISDVAENAIVAMHTPAYIKSDMVQVTHHGFNFLNKLYPMINAKIAVFPQSAFYMKDPNNGQSNLYKYQQIMTYSTEEYFAHKYTYKFTVVGGAFKSEALPRYDAAQ